MPDPNVAILNRAWSLLWRQGSAYYLPAILANGATFGGTTIPSLTTVTLADIGSIPLYTSDTWGNVSVTLTSAKVTGLPNIQDVSFTPSSDARSITAKVAFPALTFSGSFEVDGTGLAGCAMDMAEDQAYNVPVIGAGQLDATPPPPQNMDQARRYRDELVRSNNGANLVGKYYDHNDAVNMILSRDNVFTRRWPGGVTPDAHDTAYYMQMTSAATAHRDDPDYTVGGNDTGYVAHGAFMQTSLIAACSFEAGRDPEHAEAFRALARDASQFQQYTNQYPDPMTAGEVMSTVTDATPLSAAELAAVPEPAAVRAGRLAAEEGLAELERTIAAELTARQEQVTTYRSTGEFSFGFSMATLAFGGDVAIAGTPPVLTMTAKLTSLAADIPNLKINLLNGTDPALTGDAQSQIDNAQWFQKSLGSYVNGKLGSADVLSYLSGVINQAIINILG